MTYLVASELPTVAAGERFRTLLARPGILQIPGAYNGLAAIQAKLAGFETVYLSGAAMSASMGLPDLGILTIDDVCFFVRQISRASQLPILVDGDTGFGEALNVMHMIRCFEDAGAAAVQIEDQVLPKKCGHLNDKRLVPAEDMVPLLANMTEFGRTPYMTAKEFEQLGYKMVIWPVSALRMAAKAHDDLYAGIRNDGGAHRLIDRMQTRAELYATIGYHEFEALDSSIVASIAPEGMPQRKPG
jgi:2-methylisocitrate lyase-like PEP mutase family enzyme